MQLTASIVFAAASLAAIGCDLAARRVPNTLNVAILGAGLAFRLLAGGLTAVGWGVLGALAGLALLVPIYARGWIGGGDVKFVAAAGAWLGPLGSLWATLIGVAAGGLVSLAVLALGGAELRRKVAGNLTLLATHGVAPAIGERAARHKVPQILALAGAALAVFLFRGGFHGWSS